MYRYLTGRNCFWEFGVGTLVIHQFWKNWAEKKSGISSISKNDPFCSPFWANFPNFDGVKFHLSQKYRISTTKHTVTQRMLWIRDPICENMVDYGHLITFVNFQFQKVSKKNWKSEKSPTHGPTSKCTYINYVIAMLVVRSVYHR